MHLACAWLWAHFCFLLSTFCFGSVVALVWLCGGFRVKAGAENRTVQTTDETPPCHRRPAKRVGPRPRFAAGSLSRFAQSKAPKLLHRRGLQPKAPASSRGLGIAEPSDCQTEHRAGQLKSRKGRFHFKKCFPARFRRMMGQSHRPSGSRSPIIFPREYHKRGGFCMF